MKAFIAACLILLLLIGGITANGIIMHNRLREILDAVLLLPDTLPDEGWSDSSAVAAFYSLWDEIKPLAALTVSAARLESVERTLGTLHAGWDARDDAMYRQARAELLLLLRQIRAAESFALDSIL